MKILVLMYYILHFYKIFKISNRIISYQKFVQKCKTQITQNDIYIFSI